MAYSILEGRLLCQTIGLTGQKKPVRDLPRYPSGRHGKTVHAGTNQINFEDGSITENTRVSYLHFISNAQEPSIGNLPRNIFFLTCDAFGVLPPIARLSPGQTVTSLFRLYHQSGRARKGCNQPQAYVQRLFSAPFSSCTRCMHRCWERKCRSTRAECMDDQYRLDREGPYGIGNRMKPQLHPGHDHCRPSRVAQPGRSSMMRTRYLVC